MRRSLRWLYLPMAMALGASLSGQTSDAPTPADLIVTHAHVVTMNERTGNIERGAVIIKDARIVAGSPAAIVAQPREPCIRSRSNAG
jgi:hypothetical protein